MTGKEALKELSYLQQAAAKDNTLILEALDTIKKDLEVLEKLPKYKQILTFEINGKFKVYKALEITNDLTKEELEKIKEDFKKH